MLITWSSHKVPSYSGNIVYLLLLIKWVPVCRMTIFLLFGKTSIACIPTSLDLISLRICHLESSMGMEPNTVLWEVGAFEGDTDDVPIVKKKKFKKLRKSNYYKVMLNKKSFHKLSEFLQELGHSNLYQLWPYLTAWCLKCCYVSKSKVH